MSHDFLNNNVTSLAFSILGTISNSLSSTKNFPLATDLSPQPGLQRPAGPNPRHRWHFSLPTSLSSFTPPLPCSPTISFTMPWPLDPNHTGPFPMLHSSLSSTCIWSGLQFLEFLIVPNSGLITNIIGWRLNFCSLHPLIYSFLPRRPPVCFTLMYTIKPKSRRFVFYRSDSPREGNTK